MEAQKVSETRQQMCRRPAFAPAARPSRARCAKLTSQLFPLMMEEGKNHK